ncbi:MAG: hypothetical protein PVG39_00880 [Desulfobacteraceae bacterium]|jgi:hypothetical protein
MPSLKLPYDFNLRHYQDPVWQAFVVNNIRRGITVWPRRNGKDLVAINILTAKAVQRKGLYLYMAPFSNQARQIIWLGADGSGRKFLDYIPRELIKNKRETGMELELKTDSVLKVCGSDNIDSIMGTNPVGIIFTEFSLHRPEAWHYLRPILAENNGWALFNGTPRGLNHMYQLFRAAEKNENWFSQYLTRDDTGVPTLEAIQQDRESGMPESLIQQEYYCSWTASSENVLIPLDIIQPAVNNRLKEEDFGFAPKIVGVDPAYSAKGDSATIAKRQGRHLYPILKFKGVKPQDLGSIAVKEASSWGADAIMVDSGRGEGVINQIEKLGYGDILYPVHFAARLSNSLYLNKRAEIYGKVKDWFMAGAYKGQTPSIPDDENLIVGLSTPTCELNDKGYIQMESKQHIRSRAPGTPFDEADALAVTFAEEVDVIHRATPQMRERGITDETLRQMRHFKEKRDRNYDPMNFYNDDYDPFI